MTIRMEDVCFVKMGRGDNKFEWLVRSVYMIVNVYVKKEHLEIGVHQRSGMKCSGEWFEYYDWTRYKCPYMGSGWL